MPSYKNDAKKQNKWYCQFYYSDLYGNRKKKKKEGFATKKEADEWEREFLLSRSSHPDMTFESLYRLYWEDVSSRLKLSTLTSKEMVYRTLILPVFKDLPVSEITPSTVRQWQNDLLAKNYSQTYLRNIHAQLTAVFHYGVKFHRLPENPCTKAGVIGKMRAGEMKIWTLEEYRRFSDVLKEEEMMLSAFHVLFFCGIRIGELLALTWEDLDLESKTLRVNKTYHRLNKEDIISPPKTEKSNRTILIPDEVAQALENYKAKCYNPDSTERVYPISKWKLQDLSKKIALSVGLEPIRLHDFRHSHASLLINSGVNPLLVSRRLGHENVQTTLNTYSHIYEKMETEAVGVLNNLTEK